MLSFVPSWSALHKNNQFKQNYMIFSAVFEKPHENPHEINLKCLA